MLDAADILVDGEPMIDRGAVRRRLRVRRGEAGEVPGRVDEGVHRVGLALGRAAALRTIDVAPRRMVVERIAGPVEIDVVGKRHRQVLAPDRHHAAGRTMDHRDRAAPIALARDAPVAQAEIHLPLADGPVAARLRFKPPRDLLLCRFDRHAVEEARVDHAAVAVIGDVGDDEGRRVLTFRTDDGRCAEPVLVDEVEVALVVRRAAEDGAGAVVHEHEVRDVDRKRPGRIERVDRLHPGVEAELLGLLDQLLRRAGVLALRDEGGERRILGGRGGRKRMVGRERHELRAEQRVVARREDLDLALRVRRGLRVEREADEQSLGAADPFLLHEPHFVRPAVESGERVEKLLAVMRDREEPLRQLALLDLRAGAPALAVDHLLVGEHGAVDRVPVHLRGLAGDQAGVEEIEKEALLLGIILDVAGGELAAPVERQPHRLQLRAHRRDVVVGPGARMHLVLLRRRSRPAARTRPSPSDAARCNPAPADSAPKRRPSCSCGRAPCGCARRGRGTSPARSIWGGNRASASQTAGARPRPIASAARRHADCSARWT